MKPTLAQRKRLEKLATYLESLPEDYDHFTMNFFVLSRSQDEEVRYARENGGVASCGAVACAVGHGPAAGILVPLQFIRRNCFKRLYVAWYEYAGYLAPEEAYNWLFIDDWKDYDNHHWGAAARIRYYLEDGVPKGFLLPKKKWLRTYASYRIDARETVDG